MLFFFVKISLSVNSYPFRSLPFFLKLDQNPLIRLNNSLFELNFEVIKMERNELSAHIGIIIAGLSFGAVPIFSALLREAQVSSFEQCNIHPVSWPIPSSIRHFNLRSWLQILRR